MALISLSHRHGRCEGDNTFQVRSLFMGGDDIFTTVCLGAFVTRMLI